MSSPPWPLRGVAALAVPWLAGTLAVHQLPVLPDPVWYAPALVATLLLLRDPRLRCLTFAVASFFWTAHCAELRLADRLPATDLGRDVPVSGWIDSFPDPASGQVTFSFAVVAPRAPGVPSRIRLTWYDPPSVLKAGTPLELVVRLRPPRGLRNPGGFDYERWLMLGGYGATGYVRSGRIAPDAERSARRAWLELRARIADRLDALAPDAPGSALLIALSIGERFGFTDQHWTDFRITGTTHLVAVSGMHVALLGVVVFVVLRFVWIRLPAPLAQYDLEAAALASLAATAAYAALTGFAVPAQRSLLMIGVALAIVVSRRRIAAHQGLAAALLLVLLWDPFAPLAASFWLSFGAVALLLMLAGPRALRANRPTTLVERAARAARGFVGLQWAISLALLPLTALFFTEVSVVGPLANLVAIPLFNGVLVPLTLAATLVLGVDCVAPAIVHGVGVLASSTLDAMHAVASFRYASLALAQPAPWAIGLAGCGVVLASGSQFLPGRPLAWLALLPLFLPSQPKLAPGEARVVVLDVGHGLAVLVDTRDHRALFDAGPSYRSGFDSGERIALPALASRGRRRLDLLIVSHDDNDHSGGAAAIARAFPDAQVLIGPDVDAVPGRRCARGQSWTWDGVLFSVLHPPDDLGSRGNDSSCVLKITTASGAALLTGDIEARGEQALLRDAEIGAAVVVVPHHGSATSSSARFVAATGAELALVSAAYANRWGFPRPEVRRRWEASGARMLVTGDTGAITVELAHAGVSVRAERERRRRYWYANP